MGALWEKVKFHEILDKLTFYYEPHTKFNGCDGVDQDDDDNVGK